jgi:hypothetical protein
MRKLYRSMALIVCVAALRAGAVQAAQEDVATSIVVQIRTSATEASAQVHQELARRIVAMVTRFEANLQKAQGLLDQAKKGAQPGLVAQFEEQLAKAMQEAAQDFKAILGQQEPATEALRKLEEALKTGGQLYQGQVTQLQATRGQLTEDRQKLEAQLHDLAWRYRQVLANGQLPVEVDALVRSLETQRRTMEMREQIQQKRVAVVTANLRSLEQYGDYTRRLRGLSQQAFAQAHGQLGILGDLAILRADALNGLQLQQTTAEFGTETRNFLDTMQKNDGLLDLIINLPLPGALDGQKTLPVVDLPQGQGIDILRRYLKPATAR